MATSLSNKIPPINVPLTVNGSLNRIWYEFFSSLASDALSTSIDSDLTITGDVSITGNETVSGTFDATGNITTGGTFDATGNITTGGTVDGRDVAADGTKLDGIESSADVTDEANVTNALDGATLSAATVATGDKVLIQDVDDSDNLKTATAQSIADLAGGSSGKILQVQSTTKTDTFTTASTTYTDITGLSVSITPASTSNTIFIMASVTVANDTNDASIFIQAVRDSTAILVGDAAGSRSQVTSFYRLSLSANHDKTIFCIPVSGVDSPSTTSATTYKLQMKVDSGTNGYVNRTSDDTDSANRPRASSSITVMEISA